MARPVFARVLGPQTGIQKNHLFPSLEGAKSLENQCDLRIAGEKAFGVYDVLDRKQSSLQISGQLLVSSSLIAALRAWCMFVCYNACGGHPP